MKKLVLIFCFCGFSGLGLASDNPDINACLKAWGKHPFGAENQTYRTIGATVKVIGIGSSIDDEKKTEKPELVLVKPPVSVLTKQTIRLLNPNGWYCLKGAVTVLGKAVITVDCKAKLISSDDGVAIAGSDKDKMGSASVLAKLQIDKVGCEEKK